jgi:hypothetical protein
VAIVTSLGMNGRHRMQTFTLRSSADAIPPSARVPPGETTSTLRGVALLLLIANHGRPHGRRADVVRALLRLNDPCTARGYFKSRTGALCYAESVDGMT